ncbi:hypothetical protein B0H11DRAFT_2230480 [Mycena galericulata]|nr:hypothetical protein B0H11DRAFT_2230480 [Mycena galericulata]
MAPPLLSDEQRLIRRRNQSRKYNNRNYEERNAKKRRRMAELRSPHTLRSPEETAARQAARRASDRKYRETHRAVLATKARMSRRECAADRAEARAAQEAIRQRSLQRSRAVNACRRAILKIRAAAEAASSDAHPDSPPAASAPAPDFQRGERHINVDYDSRWVLPQGPVTVSYDISCTLVLGLDGSFRRGIPPFISGMNESAIPLVEWAARQALLFGEDLAHTNLTRVDQGSSRPLRA